MSNEGAVPQPVPQKPFPQGPKRLVRSEDDRVIAGVCAGVAHYFGIEPILVRVATVILGLISGGTALLAYLVGWVLIPAANRPQSFVAPPPVRQAPPIEEAPTAGAPVGKAPGGEQDTKAAWNAVGSELRGLAASLRKPTPATPAPEPGSRGPLQAADAAVTAFGDRLRDPEVTDAAKRTATRLTTAVTTSVEDLTKRVRGQ